MLLPPAWTSATWTIWPSGLERLRHCPEPAPPAVPPLSGRKPSGAGAHTYHVQRPAALMDEVGVEHHGGPPENPQICRGHNSTVRRLGQG